MAAGKSDSTREQDEHAEYASPPCFAHELEYDNGHYVASPAVTDRQTSTDVARWRKAERTRLIEARSRIAAKQRQQLAVCIAERLERLPGLETDSIISVYWPFRGEVNLRNWMQRRVESGTRVVLPLVETKGRALRFREWKPDSRMQPGIWNIPVPVDGEELDPTIVIAPLVGYDPQCFRLGYGGGYFDRTLAELAQRGLHPLCIGVGFELAAIPTIYPQAHDVPMDWIVTPGECIGRQASP